MKTSTIQCNKEERSVNCSLTPEAQLIFAPLDWVANTFQLVLVKLGTYLCTYIR